jgi:hypothetical protein
MQALFVHRRVIHDTAVHFYPGVREKRRRTIADHQEALDTTFPKEPGGYYGALQAVDALPVETRGQRHGVADDRLRARLPGSWHHALALHLAIYLAKS